MYCKSYYKVLCFFLVLAILFSCLPVGVYAATGTVRTNTGMRDLLCTELSSQALKYYSGQYSYGNLSALSGRSSPTDSYTATVNNPLYTALHDLMASTHSYYPIYSGYEADSLATHWLKTDAEGGSDTYLYFYTDRLRSDLSTAQLNREHVWPKSKASYMELNGGADLHHLRPSVSSVNYAKSDHSFMDIPDSAYGRTTSNIDGKVVLEVLEYQGKVEVRDNVKGDIARILLYVYCRWKQPNLYSDVAKQYLPAFDPDDTSNNGTRAIEDLDTLLRWCAADPVDMWEMGRNDQTENIQGNRNVFIDYPELAWQMFGLEPPKDMPTPSGKASAPSYTIRLSVNDLSLGSASLNGNLITAVPAENCLVSGYTVLSGSATVTQDGNTFAVEPSADCHIQIQFRKKASVTLTFQGAETMTGFEGDCVLLPQAPTPPEGYTFIGWCTDQIEESTSIPTYFEEGSSYTLTESTQFYGLYSHTAEVAVANGNYTKVTAPPTDWSGDYVLVYESGKYIFNGALSNPNTMGNYRSVSITKNTIPYSSAHSYRLTVAKRSDGAYSLRCASGVYIGSAGSYSGLSYSASDQYSNRIELNSDSTVTITAGNGFKLGCFSAVKRFQYFSGSSNYGAVTLYRRATSEPATVYTTELPASALDETILIRHSLNLASDISINYAVTASQLADYESFYMECILPIYSGNVLTGSRTVTISPVATGGYYYFTLTGITAVNMNDEIHATLHMVKDGREYTSLEDVYSICSYAYSQLEKGSSTEKLKRLCAELLRYGSCAQSFKSYRTDALPDHAMTETYLSYLCDPESVPFSQTNYVRNDLSSPLVTWVGKALNLESKVSLLFIIDTGSYTGDPEKLRLHVTYTNYQGEKVTTVLENCTVYNSSRSYYSFAFDGLLAAELRSDVAVAVYEGSTQISQTLEYNAATYGNNKTGALLALCQALFAYADAAKAQFS